MRIPTIALPLVGATGGLLLAGTAALASAALWTVAGAAADRAFTLATWGLVSGVVTGGVLGLCRAIDRWTCPINANDSYRRDERGRIVGPLHESRPARQTCEK